MATLILMWQIKSLGENRILRCDTLQSGRNLPTFRRKVLRMFTWHKRIWRHRPGENPCRGWAALVQCGKCWLYDGVGQGCTNLERQIARTIKFRSVAPTFWSSIWNLLHISPQAPRLLSWLLYTLKIINSCFYWWDREWFMLARIHWRH